MQDTVLKQAVYDFFADWTGNYETASTLTGFEVGLCLAMRHPEWVSAGLPRIQAAGTEERSQQWADKFVKACPIGGLNQ